MKWWPSVVNMIDVRSFSFGYDGTTPKIIIIINVINPKMIEKQSKFIKS